MIDKFHFLKGKPMSENVAEKKRIATEVVKANSSANAKDVEKHPDWIAKGFGKCGGTVLNAGRKANGVPTKKLGKKFVMPTSEEIKNSLHLCHPFGNDLTKTIAFLQSVNEVGGAQRAVACLVQYERMKKAVNDLAECEKILSAEVA